MSDETIRNAARSMLVCAPADLLTTLGEGMTLRLRDALTEAISSSPTGRDPAINPMPGDVVRKALEDGNWVWRRVYERREENGTIFLRYNHDPWDGRERPKTRETNLALWQAWCNDLSFTVARRPHEPELCVGVSVNSRSLTCNREREIRQLVSDVARSIRMPMGEEALDEAWAVSQPRRDCSGCARNRRHGVPVSRRSEIERAWILRDIYMELAERLPGRLEICDRIADAVAERITC